MQNHPKSNAYVVNSYVSNPFTYLSSPIVENEDERMELEALNFWLNFINAENGCGAV